MPLNNFIDALKTTISSSKRKTLVFSLSAAVLLCGFFVYNAYAEHAATVSVSPGTVNVGQTVDLTFTVTKDSGDDIKTVAISNDGTGFSNPTSVTCPAGWNYAGKLMGYYICTGSGLTEAVVKLNVVTAPIVGGNKTFNIQSTDINDASATLSETVNVKTLSATATISPVATNTSQTRTYTFTITNTGDDAITKIHGTLGATTDFMVTDCSATDWTGDDSANSFELTGSSLAPGAHLDINVVASALATAGSKTISMEITGAAGGTASITPNPSAILVQTPASLSASTVASDKTYISKNAEAVKTATISANITNSGGAAANLTGKNLIIRDSAGVNISEQFTIANTDGFTTIAGSETKTLTWTVATTADTAYEGLSQAAISISYTDANDSSATPLPANTLDAGIFTVDSTAPTFSALHTDKSLVKAGDEVQITFTANETLDSNPVVKVDNNSADFVSASGNDFIYKYTVLDDASDRHDATISVSGADMAGNATTETNTTLLEIDTQAPSFININTTNPNLSGKAKVGDIITIALDSTETLANDPSVTVGGQAATKDTANSSGLHYVYTRTLDGTEDQPSATVTISGTDAAGNSGNNPDAGTITTDFSAPTFTITYYSDSGLETLFSNNYMKANTYYIKVSASEALSSAPTISIAAEGAVNDVASAATTAVSGNDYVYQRIIAADNAAVGLIAEEVTITGTDASGNTTTNGAVTGEKFTDTVAPSTSITSPAASSWQNANFTVGVSDNDAGSGIATTEYQVLSDLNNNGTITDDEITKAWASRTPNGNVALGVGDEKDCQNEGIDACKVWVRAIDNAGNTNWSLGSYEIRKFSIDWTAPDAATISVAGGTVVTKDSTPALNLTAGATTPDYMRFSCNATNWSEWTPWATSYDAFDLTSEAGCSAGDGSKTVYVSVEDAHGNVQTTANSDSIIYDSDNTLTVGESKDFASIQDAIDNATAGDTIEVAAGTYTTTGQIVINKNITVTGIGDNKPTISPVSDLQATNNVAGAWFLINAGVTFNINNLVLDGNGMKVYQGIRSHGTTTIDEVDFLNIQDNTSPYVGFAIANFGGTIPRGAGSDTNSAGGLASSLTVTDSTFASIGRIGVLTKGSDSTATLTGNTFTGKGTGNFLNYAFEVGAGGSATITSNQISGCKGLASTDGSTSAGILVTDYFGTGTSATISGNTISDCTDAIAVGYDNTDLSVVIANNNKFNGNVHGINSTGPHVAAENNWWGVAVPNFGSIVLGSVDYDPWYMDEDMEVLSSSVGKEVVYVEDATTANSTDGHYLGFNAFTNIQDAIDAVDTGGKVHVAAGTYPESVNINKELTLQGADKDTTVIRFGYDSYPSASPLVITAANVTVSGLTIQSGQYTEPTWTVAISGNSATLTDLHLIKDAAVWGNGSPKISGAAIGFVAPNVISSFTFTNSVVESARSGIYTTAGSSDIEIRNVNFTVPNEYGIFLNAIDGATIENNTFTITDAPGSYGIVVRGSNNITIEDNTFTGHDQTAVVHDGILLQTYSSGEMGIINITGNTFSGFNASVEIQDIAVSRVHINTNKITGNAYGVKSAATNSSDAESNWWGAATGPAEGVISGNVDYRPWCADSTCATIDTIAPTVSVDHLLTKSTTPQISGTITDSNSTDSVSVVVNSKTYNATVSSGTWTANITDALAEGVYNVSATATDPSGNQGTNSVDNATGALVVDTTIPTLTPVSIASNNSNSIYAKVGDIVTLTFTASEDIKTPIVTIAGNSATVIAGADAKNWTATYTMADANAAGLITFSISFTDLAENSGSAVTAVTENGGSVTFSKTAPTVSITSPVDGSKVNSGAIISFTNTNGTAPQCSVDNTHWTTCISGTTTLNGIAEFSGLSEGVFTLYLKDADAAGNTGNDSVSLIKDTELPSVLGDSLSPAKNAVGVALDATISLAFNEEVVIGSVVVKNNTTNAETTIQGAGISFDGTTNTATVTLPAGTLQSNTVYTVKVIGIADKAGNSIGDYGSDDSWQFTTATGYSISLTSGWNLISLPVTPTTWRSIPDTLASIAGKVNRIWTYDAPAGKWLVYNTDPSVPSDANFTSLEAGRGYWIDMNSSGTLTGSGTLYEQLVPSGGQPSSQLPQVQLAEGWNLIGYYQLPGETTASIADALSKLSGAWSGAGSDVIAFTPNTLQPLTPILVMEPGKGYWIYMNSAKLYSFGN
jgi:hypothetical protein